MSLRDIINNGLVFVLKDRVIWIRSNIKLKLEGYPVSWFNKTVIVKPQKEEEKK